MIMKWGDDQRWSVRHVGRHWPAAVVLVVAVGAACGSTSGSDPGHGSAYARRVVLDGATGYWRLGDGGEVVASAVGDAAGRYHGSYETGIGGAIFGDSDAAVSFGGDGGIVIEGLDGVEPLAESDFTVEIWLRTPSADDSYVVGSSGAARSSWGVVVTDDEGHWGEARITAASGSTEVVAYGGVRVDDGAWHHLAVTFDRSRGIRIHTDGVEGQRSEPAPDGSDGPGVGDLELLVAAAPGRAGFVGDLEELAIYSRAMSLAHVAEHAAAGRELDDEAVDTIPPFAAVVEPGPGAAVRPAAFDIWGIAGNARDDQLTVVISVSAPEDATFGRVVSTSQLDGEWSITVEPLPPGCYTVEAEQRDGSGNVGRSEAVMFDILPFEDEDDWPMLLAAGDIAGCQEGSGETATAEILMRHPDAVVAVLGDAAYPDGTPEQFADCYDPTWGRAKSRTRPAVGDHEYTTPGAAGYSATSGRPPASRERGGTATTSDPGTSSC